MLGLKSSQINSIFQKSVDFGHITSLFLVELVLVKLSNDVIYSVWRATYFDLVSSTLALKESFNETKIGAHQL